MSGNNSSPWFKIFALCTAIGFGGIYVWRQQQKAVPQIDKTIQSPVLPVSKSPVFTPTSFPVDQETNLLLMPSSKSAGVFKPAQEKWQERMMLSGSKSGTIQLGSKMDIPLPSPELPNPPKQRTLLPGSKSSRVLETQKINPVLPSPEPVAPQERTLLPSSKSIPMPIFRERRIAPEDQPKPDEP